MPTYTSQPTVDTYINNGAPTTNFGSNQYLNIGEANVSTEKQRTLIKDSFSGLSSANIISATLKLTVVTDFSDNTRTIRAFRLKRAWVESEATWNKYDSANSWSTAGGFHADDCEQTDIGSVSIGSGVGEGTVIEISLTPSSIQEMCSGTFTNNGLLIKADTEKNDCYRYASSDHATSSYRPKLVIEYTVPVNGVPVTYISDFGMI